MSKHKKASATKIVKRSTYSAVTLLAVVFVFVIAGYYLLQNAKLAGTSQLLISPASVNVQAGNTFTVDVKDNTTTPVNMVKTNVTFNPSVLEVTNVDFNGSFYTKVSSATNSGSVTADMYYLKPLYDQNGNLIGNEPPPTGQHLIHKITFKAKTAGTAQINFGSGSNLLDRDTNTSVLGASNGATVTITGNTNTPAPTTPPSTGGGTTKPSTTTKPSAGTPTSNSNSSTGTTGSTPTPTESSTGTEATTTAEGSQSPIIPLTLTILDANGKPVSGADVTIEGNTVKTDESGKAAFVSLAAGKYSATVKVNGAESSYPVEIAAGQAEAQQTIQLVAASNQLPVPFVALALGFLALSGVAILYIFGHKFLKRPHLEEAAAMAPIASDSGKANVQSSEPAPDNSMLSELESIQTTSVQPGAVIHPQEYSEHSSLHPDNQPESTPGDTNKSA